MLPPFKDGRPLARPGGGCHHVRPGEGRSDKLTAELERVTKVLQTVVVALLVAGVAVGFWLAFRGEGGTLEREPRVRPVADAQAAPASAGARDTEAPAVGFDWRKTLPGWIEGQGLPAAPARDDAGATPRVVRELSALTRGVPPGTSSLAIKRKVQELSFALDRMTDEELEQVASAFAASDDAGLKYQMLVAFHLRAASPVLVDAVQAYYEADPILVGDVLQQIAARRPESDVALNALNELVAHAVEPQERELLLSRIAMTRHPQAQDAIFEALASEPGTHDRRVAVAALGVLGTPEARAHLEEILDGGREEAFYPPTVRPPHDEMFRDLRAHAVNATIASGHEDGVARLLERLRTDPEDPVSGYAMRLLPALPGPQWIPEVVDLAVEHGRLEEGVLHYLIRSAGPEDAIQLERLRGLPLDPALRDQVDELIARLR